MKLVKATECSEYGFSRETVDQYIHHSKKDKGYPPKWAVYQDGNLYIDVDIISEYANIEREVWNYVTDSSCGIYWLMRYYFDVTDWKQASIMAEKSKRFNSVNSWAGFINNSMFSSPVDIRMIPKYTMMIDYIFVMTRLIHSEIKSKGLDGMFNKIDEIEKGF